MIKFIKNILATIWLVFWALIFRWAEKNDFAPNGKAEGELSLDRYAKRAIEGR